MRDRDLYRQVVDIRGPWHVADVELVNSEVSNSTPMRSSFDHVSAQLREAPQIPIPFQRPTSHLSMVAPNQVH